GDGRGLTCAICLELYLEPVTLPCGHNFCGDCIRDWWGCRDKACPECREHFPDGAELRRNVALSGVLELMRAGPAPAPEAPGPLAPVPSPVCPLRRKLWQSKEPGTCACAEACVRWAIVGTPCVHVSTCACLCERVEGARAVTALSRVSAPCPSLGPPPTHLLQDRVCLCEACAAQEHRGHQIVPLEQERALQEAEQSKVLSAVEDRMDELGAGIAQSRRTVALIKSAAAAERERVSRLFAEAAAVLQGFQTEVLGFIEEGEATMLGRSQGDLRRQEEQRSRLSQARHNLSQVPEADSVSFLQELLALRLALEEGCGPGPGPPRELSFTKSSQAVQSVRELLTAACASQWEQLRGLGSDEDELQKLGTEADAESQDPDSTNSFESEAPRDYFLKFAYIVDLDSDTADKYLQLFGTKGVKRVLCPINYPESPTRFTHCEQVLGEGALDRGTYYWEVEIIEGWVSVGVMAEDFSPQEPYDRGRLGRNAHSCCLQWNGRSFSIWFRGLEAPLSHPFSPTVGICLEYADRALAFYAVRDGKMSLLRRLKASRARRSSSLSPAIEPFQSCLDSHFAGLFTSRLKPAFFLESVDAHLQIGPLKKSCISVLKRR
uniref:RING-type E3 ubiquitin transferase n=2 Tax=Suricata suricatta TaxID=37032 RepID=A0A673UKT1_SURSU